MKKQQIALSDIQKARVTIAGKVYRTPLVNSEKLTPENGSNLFLKLENLQRSGAFKIRGVINKINHLTDTEKKIGVICATSGNHGLGVAWVAKEAGIKATVVVPEITPNSKIDKLRTLTQVEVYGESYLESYHYALEKARKNGLTFIHGFDDPHIIAGQATIALEIIEEIPDVSLIVAPIGGGGLISGILIATKIIRPGIKIIGVQAEGAPSMYLSWKQNRVVQLPEVRTFANGIAVKKPGRLNFTIITEFIDDIVLVKDAEIKVAQKKMFGELKMVVEGAGAASLAAVMNGKIRIGNKKTVCVISGGNVSTEELAEITGN